MSLHDESAIVFRDVCKTYRLYRNQWQMVKDILGFKTKELIPEFHALKNVNLAIKKGERIGLVGRNGAGKSSLLKLITGNFAQTSGEVIVQGKVQALMNTGVGFHPDFTGFENIHASLLYNGLSDQAFQAAVDDIVDFVELGEFLHQPLKTYSLGMQSRLYFAVATAILPEILIVDEVLGAGDAYFSAKSADRMKKLTGCGCTLILVSHSSQQILQFCEKAIWLECGEIVMQGTSIDVINAYEAYSKKLEAENAQHLIDNTHYQSTIQSKWLREKILRDVLKQDALNATSGDPHDNANPLRQTLGISRWPSLEQGLKIHDLLIKDGDERIVHQVQTFQPLNIDISVIAEETGHYDVYVVILLFTEDGRWLTRHCTDKMQLTLGKQECYTIRMQYDKVLLGNGQYFFSAALYKVLDLKDLSTARYYDLLSRSFEFKVNGDYVDDGTLFHHPVKWLTHSRFENHKEGILL